MAGLSSNPLVIASAPGVIAAVAAIWQGRKTRRVNTQEHGGTGSKLDDVLTEARAAKTLAATAANAASRTSADVRVIKAEVAGLRDWRDEHTQHHEALARPKH